MQEEKGGDKGSREVQEERNRKEGGGVRGWPHPCAAALLVCC